MDDVTSWLDTTESLINTYESREKTRDDEDDSRDQEASKDDGIKEEIVHVVEEILVSRKWIRFLSNLRVLIMIIKTIMKIAGHIDLQWNALHNAKI